MKRNTVIILVVVVLLILGGGVFAFLGQSHTNTAQNAMPQSQSSKKMTSHNMSLFDLFSMAGTQKCTFSDAPSNSSGTVYLSSGKVNGDFQSTENGKTETTHMISDGKYVYYWLDDQTNGDKMSLDTLKSTMSQSSSSGSQPAPSQAMNMQQKANYSCGPTIYKAEMFMVPTNITFTDFSAMMQGAQGGATGTKGSNSQGNQSDCSECNQVPAGAARNQCRAALKCQ